MTLDTQYVFSISFRFVSYTRLGGHCIYNSFLLMNLPILGAALLTASYRHDLRSKLLLVWHNWESERYINLVLFIPPQFFLLVFSHLYHSMWKLSITITSITSHFTSMFLFVVMFWFYTDYIIIYKYTFAFCINIYLVKNLPYDANAKKMTCEELNI